MSSNKIVIFGNSDIAEIANFYFERDTDFSVCGFTVDGSYLRDDTFCGRPIVAFDEVQKYYPPSEYQMFVALAYTKLNQLRRDKYLSAKQSGYSFVKYVSSKAACWDHEVVGENSFVLENVVIQPFTRVGNNVTIWSGTHVGHHSLIRDHCFITSQVVISGGVDVGECCFIGVNATLRDHVTIGRDSVIGAGTLILSNVEAESVYKGTASEKATIPSSKLRSL